MKTFSYQFHRYIYKYIIPLNISAKKPLKLHAYVHMNFERGSKSHLILPLINTIM